MRVSPASLDEALGMARRVTEVTHNHPDGLKGAAATAHAIFLARHGTSAGEIRAAIDSAYGYDLSMTVDQIGPGYRFNETCQETVPQALVCALEATGFEDAIRNSISKGRANTPRQGAFLLRSGGALANVRDIAIASRTNLIRKLFGQYHGRMFFDHVRSKGMALFALVDAILQTS